MHILVGTDGSHSAIAAATRALQLFASAETVTLLTTTLEPLEATQGLESGFAGGIASPEQIEAGFQRVNDEARAALAATMAALQSTSRPPLIRERIEIGDPGARLCSVAAELMADVIVVGSRGHGAVKRVLLGSVSSYVVHHAQCPVLVVPCEMEHVETARP